MKETKVGFIGVGNMGSALARAVSRAGYTVLLCDRDEEKARHLALELGGVASSLADIEKEADYVFLGIKPAGLSTVTDELKKALSQKTVISMLAGVSVADVSKAIGTKVIRIMPNTSVGCGEGMVLWCAEDSVIEAERVEFESIMSKCGRLDLIPESMIDAATAISGCGPAFVYMFIEALADGGVRCGIPRDKAMTYACQTLIGAAKNALVSQKQPGELKDAVCSPGGSTIEGVRALEANGMRSAVIEAVIASFEKTKELGKK